MKNFLRFIRYICPSVSKHASTALMALLLIPFLASPLRSFGEGTKELLPSDPAIVPTTRGCLYLSSGSTYLPWALHSNTDDNLRLKFSVSSNWANEVVFIGLNSVNNISSFYIRYPDGTYSAAQTFPTGGPGYISNWNQAVSGPNVINPSGYEPIVFTPTMEGDYSIDFEGNFSGSATIEYFDITVATSNGGGSYTPIPGRVWSKVWQIYAMHSNQFDNFRGIFYVYSDDHIVTKFNANGMRVGACDIYCNEWGTSTTGDWETRRKSIEGKAGVVPQYKMFLNEPDIALFPTGILGQIISAQQTSSSCDGSVIFEIVVDKPGKVTLSIDLPPAGLGDPNDVYLNQNVVAGSNLITWNGNNGSGQPVNNGASISMSIDYLNSLTNLPLYDVEGNEDGIKVDIHKPLPDPLPPDGTKLRIYWDDTNPGLGGIDNSVTGCMYDDEPPVTGCHDWSFSSSGGLGDENTINSWWYYLSQNNVTISVSIIRTPATPTVSPTGPSPVCQGQTGA
ncbi:MAG TPA: hypothetical protein PLJ84_12545, partial [Bacteroidales bacterium]|nr:hypothetical protein [Bacteroidales bacterium]HPT03420.1 hypothetical protein [Bacteroidales bacterium]